MPRTAHVLDTTAFGLPWMMEERAFAQLRAATDARLAAQQRELAMLDGENDEDDEELAEPDSLLTVIAGVAVIPVHGLITPRPSFFSRLFGGTSLVEIRDLVTEAISRNDVAAIVLHVDSPGGRAALVPETAQWLRDQRGAKPMVAVASTMAASAAYYLASQCDEVVCTPSGSAGSIGTITLHTEFSKMDEDFGIKTTVIAAPEHKADGNPYEPLGDEAAATWLSDIKKLTAMFEGDVALGRDVTAAKVAGDFGRGALLLAEDALAAGLIDRVATLEDEISRLAAPTPEPEPQQISQRAAALLTVRPRLI